MTTPTKQSKERKPPYWVYSQSQWLPNPDHPAHQKKCNPKTSTPTKQSKERVRKSPIKKYRGGYIDGDVPCEVCQKTDNYPYWRTFTQVSFMRGDDEVNGNLCKDCYKKLRANL